MKSIRSLMHRVRDRTHASDELDLTGADTTSTSSRAGTFIRVVTRTHHDDDEDTETSARLSSILHESESEDDQPKSRRKTKKKHDSDEDVPIRKSRPSRPSHVADDSDDEPFAKPENKQATKTTSDQDEDDEIKPESPKRKEEQQEEHEKEHEEEHEEEEDEENPYERRKTETKTETKEETSTSPTSATTSQPTPTVPTEPEETETEKRIRIIMEETEKRLAAVGQEEEDSEDEMEHEPSTSDVPRARSPRSRPPPPPRCHDIFDAVRLSSYPELIRHIRQGADIHIKEADEDIEQRKRATERRKREEERQRRRRGSDEDDGTTTPPLSNISPQDRERYSRDDWEYADYQKRALDWETDIHQHSLIHVVFDTFRRGEGVMNEYAHTILYFLITQNVDVSLPDYKYKDEYDQLVFIEQRTEFMKLIKQYHERAKAEQHRLALQLKARHEELQSSISQAQRERDALNQTIVKTINAMNKANQLANLAKVKMTRSREQEATFYAEAAEFKRQSVLIRARLIKSQAATEAATLPTVIDELSKATAAAKKRMQQVQEDEKTLAAMQAETVRVREELRKKQEECNATEAEKQKIEQELAEIENKTNIARLKHKQARELLFKSKELTARAQFVILELSARNLDKVSSFAKLNPFVRMYRQIPSSDTTTAGTLYFDTTWAVQTDVVNNSQSPLFKPMRVSLWDLVTGDINMTIKLQALDYEKPENGGEHRLIGECHTQLSFLLQALASNIGQSTPTSPSTPPSLDEIASIPPPSTPLPIVAEQTQPSQTGPHNNIVVRNSINGRLTVEIPLINPKKLGKRGYINSGVLIFWAALLTQV